MLDVWQALSVSGTPSVDRGWIVNDHYFTFHVSLRGRSIYQLTVPTKSEQGQMTRAFGQIIEIGSIAAAFIPK